MNQEIIFYTIHCPACNTLQKLLDAKGIKYTMNTDSDEMIRLGMKAAPGLMVDGKLMNFKEAREWLKEIPNAN